MGRNIDKRFVFVVVAVVVAVVAVIVAVDKNFLNCLKTLSESDIIDKAKPIFKKFGKFPRCLYFIFVQ